MDLIVQHVAFIYLAVAPGELANTLHLLVLESALILGPIEVRILALSMLGSIDKVAYVVGAIQIAFRTLSMQFAVHFVTILFSSLTCDRLAHRHNNLRRLILLIVFVPLGDHRLSACERILMLLLDHSQVLLCRDLVCLGLEHLVRAGALELELASWGVCELFLVLVVFTAVDFVHASHEKLEKIGTEALGTDSGLSDVIADLLVE